MGSSSTGKAMTRRDFLRAAGAAGVGMMAAGSALGQAAGGGGGDELRLAIIGPGSQGRNLLINCLRIPGVRFTAVCDIWEYHQRYAANILKKYKQPVNVYTDYRKLLDREKGLDAVIIATPDGCHARQSCDCLDAGLHVYCEKEMSHTLEGCRQMVRKARQSGKLLQVGHQRRSNPRYWHALKMIEKERICGRITHVTGQWHRAQRLEFGWPKTQVVDPAVLAQFGYKDMNMLRNWRNYRDFSAGPMADLGSHQVDVFNWFLHTAPTAVQATGGRDYYDTGETYDNVLALYDYQTPAGAVRGQYQVLNTTSHGGFYETFMGDQGSMVVSEDSRKGFIFREVRAPATEWEDEAAKIEAMGAQAIELKVGESLLPDGTKDPKAVKLAAQAKKPVHQLHLENFFDAIKGTGKLTCPPEIAYETAVSVLAANEAVARGEKIALAPESYKV